MPERIPAAQLRRRTLGVKVTDSQYVELLPFFETFTGCSVSAALLWLLDQETTKQTIRDRVASVTVQS